MTPRPRAKKIALWIVAITLTLIALLLSRCVSLEDYEYLSFEGVKEAKVVHWAERMPDVWLKHPVPFEYEIVRDRYHIQIRLEDGTNGKLAFITLTDKAYSLAGSYIQDWGKPVYYFWPPIERKDRQAMATVSSLRFTVFDKNGKPIAQEDIPFEEKTGRWYIVVDAL